MHLEAGDSAPADGVIITNHGIKCDESSATGESDQIEKSSGYDAWSGVIKDPTSGETDPFIISGSKILEGLGTYVVTSVGTHSTYGRIMSALGNDTDPTPLQVKLGILANWIGWFGLGYVPLYTGHNEHGADADDIVPHCFCSSSFSSDFWLNYRATMHHQQ